MQSEQQIPRLVVMALLVGGAVVGGVAVEYWRSTRLSTSTAAQTDTAAAAEIARLTTLVPSQSHSMMDVGYQWTNL